MPKMMIADSYVDTDGIDSISPAIAPKSAGLFEFKAGTEVVLKNGRVLMEHKSVDELVAEIKALEAPQETTQVVPGMFTSNGSDEFVLIADAMLKQMKAMTEHLHTISECLIKQAMRPQ